MFLLLFIDRVSRLLRASAEQHNSPRNRSHHHENLEFGKFLYQNGNNVIPILVSKRIGAHALHSIFYLCVLESSCSSVK